jgi:hypothetical protein
VWDSTDAQGDFEHQVSWWNATQILLTYKRRICQYVTYFSSSSSYYLRIEEETGDNGNGYDGGIGGAGFTVTEETFS